MNEKGIQLKSHWGVTLENRYIKQDSDILAVFLPGDGYINEKPLMYYSCKIALEIGLDLLCVDYGFQVSHKDFDIDTELDIVIKESEQILKKCISRRYKKIVFIGKSLGTVVQREISKELINYEQVHIYLTPVDKTFESIVNHPCLVIIGTEDRKINRLNINTIESSNNIELVEIEGGNHRLESSDSLKSIEMLSKAMETLRKFITKNLKG